MRRPSYRDLLRLPGVGELLLGAALARLAGRMFALAIVLDVLARFDSPVFAGWVGFAAFAPGLLISPLAGAVLDRVGGLRAIILDTASSAALLLALAGLGLAGRDAAAAVLVLVALYALTSPLSAAGIRVVLPRLVPPHALERANALDTGLHAAVEVLGPAAAGALFALLGGPATLSVIAACFGLAALALLPAARAAARPVAVVRHGLLAAAASDVGHVLRHRSLRGLALSYALYQASWGVLLVAVPVAVQRAMPGGGDAVVGALWAGAGLAGGAGALVAGQLAAPGRERSMLALGMLATALALLPLCAASGVIALAVALAAAGALAGPIDVGVLTLRQRRTDPAWLGRVMAVSMSLNLSGLPIGSALGGVLVGWSLPAAFAAAGLACAAGACAAWWLVPREDG